MEYSYKKIVASLPKTKNSKSSLWVKLIVRRLSFPFTYLLINLKSSAWLISILSVFVALMGSFFVAINDAIFKILGVVLINLWLVLDCVDGNIARCKKTSSKYGEFVDALSGYYITAFVFLGIGIATFNYYTINSIYSIYPIIIGSITSITNITTRLIHQKFVYTKIISGNKNDNSKDFVKPNKGLHYLRSRVDKEIGLSGLFMPFLILTLIFDLWLAFLLFYFFFSLFGLILITVYYSLKAK